MVNLIIIIITLFLEFITLLRNKDKKEMIKERETKKMIRQYKKKKNINNNFNNHRIIIITK